MINDLISRQAAIRWVKIECNPYGNPTLDFESGKKVIEHLKQMPSAVTERKTGRWLTNSDFPDRLICSECGAQFDVWHWESEQMHFCPNCGAEMG